jgi:hypothetical protein
VTKGFKEREGDCQHHRPEHEADEPEELQAAQHREENEEFVQLGPLADEPRSQEVVDQADDENAPKGEQDGLDPGAGHGEVDRRRDPDHERAGYRDERQEDHGHAPDDGRGHAQHSESHAAEDALKGRYDEHAVDASTAGPKFSRGC